MKAVKVSVKPETLSWILEKVQEEDVSPASTELLLEWERGAKTPTFHQIEEVSRKTNIPFGYFLLDKPPAEDFLIVKYRTVSSVQPTVQSRNFIDTYDLMEDIQDWMRDYLLENGNDALSFVGSVNENTPISHIAEDIRSHLNLRADWFRACRNAKDAYTKLRSKITNAGILVMSSGIVENNTRRKLDIREFRAFTLVDSYAPLIFINTCDTDTGKLFSIVHELAHIWLGIDSFYNEHFGHDENISRIERTCNAVAAELLVPGDLFLREWAVTEGTASDRIQYLYGYFHCSRYVIARRALECQRIDKTTYDDIIRRFDHEYTLWMQAQRKKNGGNYYRTLGSRIDHRFLQALSQSTREGRTPYTDAYRLTNTNRKTFERLLIRIGG